jgi:hypothetical protein
MSSNNEMPDFNKLLGKLEKEIKLQEKLQALSESESSEVETKILMDLWKKLGDNTETYWEAMNCTACFVKAVRSSRKALKKCQPEIKALIFETIGELFIGDAETIRRIETLKMEHEHGAPPIQPES